MKIRWISTENVAHGVWHLVDPQGAQAVTLLTVLYGWRKSPKSTAR